MRRLGIAAFALAAVVTILPALGSPGFGGASPAAHAATGTSGLRLVFLNP